MLAPQPPVLDINGDLPGSTQAVTSSNNNFYPSVAADLTITSSQPILTGARIAYDPSQDSHLTIRYDTSGTNITASAGFGAGTRLSGTDTVEHYQQALRGVTVGYARNPDGYTTSLTITLSSSAGDSAPVNTLVTAAYRLDLAAVDLNGAAAGYNGESILYADRYGQPLFQEASPVIDWPAASTIVSVTIDFGGITPGNIYLDVYALHLSYVNFGDRVVINGTGTIQDYETALRSITITNLSLPGRIDDTGTDHDDREPVRCQRRLDVGADGPQAASDGRRPGCGSGAEFFTMTYQVGAPPVPVVDPSGLSIGTSVFDMIVSAEISWSGNGANIRRSTPAERISPPTKATALSSCRGPTPLPITSGCCAR